GKMRAVSALYMDLLRANAGCCPRFLHRMGPGAIGWSFLRNRLGPGAQRVGVQREKLLDEQAHLVRARPMNIQVSGLTPEDAKRARFGHHMQHQQKTAAL